MFMVPSTLQVVLGIVLVLLGVCGNLVLPFVSNRTTLRCPRITVLAALDFTAALLGPGLMLVTVVIGPTWLEHNKSLCHSLSFLSSWMFITTFLVLFFPAVFCQTVQPNIHLDGRRRARRREFALLGVCLLTGLLLGCLPLLGWSSYSGLPFFPPCSLLGHVQTSNYSIFYLASSLVILSAAFLFTVRALKRRRLYPVKHFWERHKIECRLNDPEVTTENFSPSVQSTSGSDRSRVSSIASGKRSAVNSPMASRRSSLRGRPVDSLARGVLLCSAQAHILPPPSTVPPGNGLLPIFQGGESVISASVPWIKPTLAGKRVFQSPRFLLQWFSTHQKQRSLSRLLSLRCCVTLICWLPLYVTVALQLSSVHYPQELHVFIQWLIFVQSSIFSLLPLREESYRRVLKRAALSVLKTSARQYKTHVDLNRSRDVEFKIEGTEQVRLKHLVTLDLNGLGQITA